jgi:hypothetical protein
MKHSNSDKKHHGSSGYQIDWVYSIVWILPWPTVAIMAVTHGDEPAWFSAHNFLREYFNCHTLEQWSILLIQGNPEAAKQWKICLEENLNRLFQKDSLLSQKQKESVEYRRSRELMPILESIDYLLDIHSTNNPGPVFSIIKNLTETHLDLAKHLPVEFYSYWWGDTIVWTTCDWVDAYGWIWVTIECWDHKNPQWWEVAIRAALCFLQHIGIHNFNEDIKPSEQWLEVKYAELVKDRETFEYQKSYINFESLKAWEIIAQDQHKTYRTPVHANAVIIFPTNIESIRSGAIKEAFLIGEFI